MNEINRMFLEALGASLRGERVQWENPLSTQDWTTLFGLAQAHHVLPMIFEAVYASPAAKRADAQLMMLAKRQTMQSVMMQAMKTGEFLALMKRLKAAGVTPCVVKGAVCRKLYPNPDHRISGDEDVLIPPEQFDRCHEAMLAFGMKPADPQQDVLAAHEIPYGKPGSPLYIELHKHLFPPENDAYGDFNRFFSDVHAHTMEIVIDGVSLTTLNPTDHFFYLICHAFKHFLHSGFGIRQVCDIVRFAGRYGREIDWAAVLDRCREIHAEQFAAALMKIGQTHFGFDPDEAGVASGMAGHRGGRGADAGRPAGQRRVWRRQHEPQALEHHDAERCGGGQTGEKSEARCAADALSQPQRAGRAVPVSAGEALAAAARLGAPHRALRRGEPRGWGGQQRRGEPAHRQRARGAAAQVRNHQIAENCGVYGHAFARDGFLRAFALRARLTNARERRIINNNGCLRMRRTSGVHTERSCAHGGKPRSEP